MKLKIGITFTNIFGICLKELPFQGFFLTKLFIQGGSHHQIYLVHLEQSYNRVPN